MTTPQYIIDIVRDRLRFRAFKRLVQRGAIGKVYQQLHHDPELVASIDERRLYILLQRAIICDLYSSTTMIRELFKKIFFTDIPNKHVDVYMKVLCILISGSAINGDIDNDLQTRLLTIPALLARTQTPQGVDILQREREQMQVERLKIQMRRRQDQLERDLQIRQERELEREQQVAILAMSATMQSLTTNSCNSSTLPSWFGELEEKAKNQISEDKRKEHIELIESIENSLNINYKLKIDQELFCPLTLDLIKNPVKILYYNKSKEIIKVRYYELNDLKNFFLSSGAIDDPIDRKQLVEKDVLPAPEYFKLLSDCSESLRSPPKSTDLKLV